MATSSCLLQCSGLTLTSWGPQIGSVVCNTCNERFSAKINKLSEAVDVYSEWIDACEAENNP